MGLATCECLAITPTKLESRLHERISNQRRDAHQKLSTQLVKNYDLIALEDLGSIGVSVRSCVRRQRHCRHKA